MVIKSIQSNVQHSRVATLELVNYIKCNSVDVAFVQEPYNYRTDCM